jgi:hypothetical protein
MAAIKTAGTVWAKVIDQISSASKKPGAAAGIDVVMLALPGRGCLNPKPRFCESWLAFHRSEGRGDSFVCFVGERNSGKSTLLNRFLYGNKVRGSELHAHNQLRFRQRATLPPCLQLIENAQCSWLTLATD